MLQHQDAVTHSDGKRTAGATLAGDDDDDGDGETAHLAQVPGDRLGLAALLGTDAGECARGVNEGDDGELETLGHLHQAQRLPVPFRVRHAEVAEHLFLGVAPLLVTDHHDRLAVKTGEAADDGVVVAEVAVTVQFHELGEDQAQVIEGERTIDMAGNLGRLPAGKICKHVFAHLLCLLLKFGDLRGEIDPLSGKCQQFLDLLVQFRQRLLKIKIALLQCHIFLSPCFQKNNRMRPESTRRTQHYSRRGYSLPLLILH